MRNWKEDKGYGPFPFTQQRNKWGYLNNPRWQPSPQEPVDYTGAELTEPQIWTPRGEGGPYSDGSRIHKPCGHWHKRLVTEPPLVDPEYIGIFSVASYGFNTYTYDCAGDLSEWYDEVAIFVWDFSNDRLLDMRKSDGSSAKNPEVQLWTHDTPGYTAYSGWYTNQLWECQWWLDQYYSNHTMPYNIFTETVWNPSYPGGCSSACIVSCTDSYVQNSALYVDIHGNPIPTPHFTYDITCTRYGSSPPYCHITPINVRYPQCTHLQYNIDGSVVTNIYYDVEGWYKYNTCSFPSESWEWDGTLYYPSGNSFDVSCAGEWSYGMPPLGYETGSGSNVGSVDSWAWTRSHYAKYSNEIMIYLESPIFVKQVWSGTACSSGWAVAPPYWAWRSLSYYESYQNCNRPGGFWTCDSDEILKAHCRYSIGDPNTVNNPLTMYRTTDLEYYLHYYHDRFKWPGRSPGGQCMGRSRPGLIGSLYNPYGANFSGVMKLN